MADIKQAARWMQEGKKVKRSSNKDYFWVAEEEGDEDDPLHLVLCMSSDDGEECVMSMFCDDLLAEDWELVDDQ